MWRSIALVVVVGVVAGALFAGARRAEGCGSLPPALRVLSPNKEEAAKAVAALRAQGPAGLEALMVFHRAAIERHRVNPTAADANWERLSAAIDAVAAQKDAWAAGLFWYTDLAEAKRVASAAGKPILSLRLLGTLDTEFSCANSRFFRTVLYPNAEVGKALREGFVLHWQSHRPVPRLTIDFGDGRKIERTITGNSVHYVLTPDGRVVDVIPGLYGPQRFLSILVDARSLVTACDRPGFADLLAEYHRVRLDITRQAWATDLAAAGVRALPVGSGEMRPLPPTAVAATRITAAKSAMEIRPVMALVPDRAALAAGTDDALWAKITALHADDGRLDAGSRAVIASKMDAVAANNLTVGKKKVEDPVVRVVRNFERSVAEDTVRNEYAFRSQVHEWFLTGRVPATLDELNERVYAELFLMPKSDPWLGLVAEGAYTALPGR